MSKIDRRRFLSGAATGAGAFVAGCARTERPAAPTLGPAQIGSLSTTRSTPLLAKPTFFEPLAAAARFHRRLADDQPVATLRMIIRGLFAVVIREEEIDIVLMDARKRKMPAHVGKFTVENRYAAAAASGESAANGMIEVDHPEYEPIRAWDIRGSIVTFAAQSALPDAQRITIVEQPEIYPWATMRWHLDFERIYPQGVVRSRADMEKTAGGSIAGIVRLTHGRLEPALPGRRYGNTGVWEIFEAGDIPNEQRKRWQQALSDTMLYSLDIPLGEQVTLNRLPLEGYNHGTDARPDFTPIVLNTPPSADDPLACGLSHEPPLGGATHTIELPHNRVFYELYENPPANDLHRTVPRLVEQWLDVGVGREARSEYWKVTRDPNTNQTQVNVCDPDCNPAVIGLRGYRERSLAKPQPAS